MTILCNGAVLLTVAEFRALLNYSGSLPTGTTPGKAWRRAAVYHRQGLRDEWWRGVYGEPYPEGHKLHGQIPIQWRRIVLLGVEHSWPRDVLVPIRVIRRAAA